MWREGLTLGGLVLLSARAACADLEADPQFMPPGQCWSEAGHGWEAQVDACSEVIDPRLYANASARAQAYYNRGWANVYLCRYAPALDDFRQAVRLIPGTPRFEQGLAEGARRKLLYSKASRELLVVLARTSTVDEAYANLGELEHLRERMQTALGDLRDAIAVSPDAMAFHASLADRMVRAGQFRAAHQEYSQAIRLEGGNEHVLLGRAEAGFADGDVVLARDDFREALRYMSSSPCGYMLLVRMDLALDDLVSPRKRTRADSHVWRRDGVVPTRFGEDTSPWHNASRPARVGR